MMAAIDPAAEVARLFGSPPPRPATATAAPPKPPKTTLRRAVPNKPIPVVAHPKEATTEKRILADMSKQRLASACTYQIISPADLLASPVIRDLVRGVLPRNGIAGLIGASMSGKGFLIIALLAILAESGIWFGCRVDKVPVVYVCLEGIGGIHKRIRAWEKRHGRQYPFVGIITASVDLRDAALVAALIAAIREAGLAGGVVVIDTLAQASPGTDENSSRDMGEIIAALQAIQAALGGLVLTVHHLGKDLTRGPRGHSSFLAALDACIEVRRDGDRREWVVAKAKDDVDGKAYPFRLEVVEIGTDEDGDPVTSCVVVADEDAQTATRSKLPKGGNQRIVYDALGELLRKSIDFGKAGAPATRPCVDLEAAVEFIAPRLAVEDRRKIERTRQALTGLIASNIIICRSGWLWLP